MNTFSPAEPLTTSASTSPSRIARSVSSASSRRCRSCSASLFASSWDCLMIRSGYGDGEPGEKPLLIGELGTDKLTHRQRLFPDERGGGDDAIAFEVRRFLENVDDFQIVTALQMLFANLLDVRQGARRSRASSGNVEVESVLRRHSRSAD